MFEAMVKQWRKVEKEEFDDYLEAVGMEHSNLRGTTIMAGFTVWYAGDTDYRSSSSQWFAKRIIDKAGTHHYITDL